MKQLRIVLVEYLKTLHPRVYADGKAPNDAELPYITYAFQPSSTPDESKISRIVDIDLWDISSTENSEPLEDLADKIKGDGDLGSPTGLDEKVIRNDKITVLARFESDQTVEEEDKTVMHIMQNFILSEFLEV